DGRILSRAVSFKADDHWNEPTQCRVVTYRPMPDRIAFVADLASAWIGLRRSLPANRRLAIVLANYPNKDGRIANGVGYDTPARRYHNHPTATYHDPALVRPHGYLATCVWLRHHFKVQAIIHNGKHGNLEWLPGKASGLSSSCYPEITFGPLPHLYPFIVNDP